VRVENDAQPEPDSVTVVADPRQPDPPSLAVAVTDHGSAVVIAATGEVDTLTAPLLRDPLLAAVDDAALTVLDLSGVQFLGSSGLAVLVEARGRAQEGGRRLRLVCEVRMVLRALEATGLRSLFEVVTDLPTALRD
jgi:anti-anti-sigma factor